MRIGFPEEFLPLQRLLFKTSRQEEKR